MDMQALQSPPRAGTRRGPGAHRAGRRRRASRLRALLPLALAVGIVTGGGTGMALATFADGGGAGADRLVSDVSTTRSPDAEATDDASLLPQDPEPSPKKSEPEESPSDEPDPTTDDPFADMVAEAVSRTNAEREAVGCAPVQHNDQLAEAARGHSRDMAANGYLDHRSPDGRTFSDRAAAAGYDHAMSENIAMGYQTAEQVMNGWMNSEGHRANILNCDARAVGLGVAQAADGTLYWTQVFGRV